MEKFFYKYGQIISVIVISFILYKLFLFSGSVIWLFYLIMIIGLFLIKEGQFYSWPVYKIIGLLGLILFGSLLYFGPFERGKIFFYQAAENQLFIPLIILIGFSIFIYILGELHYFLKKIHDAQNVGTDEAKLIDCPACAAQGWVSLEHFKKSRYSYTFRNLGKCIECDGAGKVNKEHFSWKTVDIMQFAKKNYIFQNNIEIFQTPHHLEIIVDEFNNIKLQEISSYLFYHNPNDYALLSLKEIGIRNYIIGLHYSYTHSMHGESEKEISVGVNDQLQLKLSNGVVLNFFPTDAKKGEILHKNGSLSKTVIHLSYRIHESELNYLYYNSITKMRLNTAESYFEHAIDKDDASKIISSMLVHRYGRIDNTYNFTYAEKNKKYYIYDYSAPSATIKCFLEEIEKMHQSKTEEIDRLRPFFTIDHIWGFGDIHNLEREQPHPKFTSLLKKSKAGGEVIAEEINGVESKVTVRLNKKKKTIVFSLIKMGEEWYIESLG